MELLPEHLDDAAGAVDFAGLDDSEVQVEDQDDEHHQGQGIAPLAHPAVEPAPAEDVQQEDHQDAETDHLKLGGHDGDAVHAGLDGQQRGGGEYGDDGDEHEEQGDDQHHLVSPEPVHPVPDVPSFTFFLLLCHFERSREI